MYAASALAQNIVLAPTIKTVAGTPSTSGFSGDGGPATSARLNNPLSAVTDSAGNMYFCDYYNHRVRRVDASTGVITTIAGTGTAGYSGDGGPATSAKLNAPGGLVLDSAGNLYVGDTNNNRVRKINLASGIITTYAGNAGGGYSGDGGQATAAAFNYPDGLGLDASGNLYIADRSNFRIRKVTASTGVVTTVVGKGTSGFSGDGGQATSAQIGQNWSVALDAAGNLYFADVENQRIRKVNTSGVISTIAGTGIAGYSGDGGAATSAKLNMGVGSSLDVDASGNVFFTDESNCRVREIYAATGNIQTIIGSGTCGFSGDGGPATSAKISGPQRIMYNDTTGSFILADTGNSVMRTISVNNISFPQTAVGSSSVTQTVYLQTTASVKINSISVPQSADGKQEFTVGTITGCTVGGSSLNASGTVCAVPITFTPGFPGQRTLPLTAVTSTGTVSFNLNGYGLGSQVVVISGNISTIAGTGTPGYSGDGGAPTAAKLNAPRRIVFDAQNNLYFGDYTNNVVRKVSANTGLITTIAGTGAACTSATGTCGDGGAATSATLNAPVGVAVDPAGDVFIVDSNDNRIRRVDAITGIITTVAGNGTSGYTGNNGLATAAELSAPSAIFLDQYNNLYIADSGNNAIREVDATTGIITTIAGTGTACTNPRTACGDGGQATSATLNFPTSVAVDSGMNVYIADLNDNRIRVITYTTGVITTVAGTGTPSFSGDGGAATSATLNGPRAVTLDSARNLYIADSVNNVVRLVSSATGIITTIAGQNSSPCLIPTATCGDGGAAISANLNDPRGVSLDLNNNIYITDTGDNRVREIAGTTASLAFGSAQLGTTSTDSPKTVTLLSTGTNALMFPIPGSGSDPSISNSFNVSPSSTCPQLTNSTGTTGQLAVGATCTYLVNFAPVAVGSISGTMLITDDATGANGSTTQLVTLTGTGTQGTPSQALTSSNQSPQFGQSVTLTDTFVAVGGILPTGAVTFYNGSTSLGTATIDNSGVATLTTTKLPIGTDNVSASYPGDSNFTSGTSNTVTETVGKAASSSTLTSSNLTPNVGQSVTLTDTIASANGVIPTGTVTFYNGTTSIGTGTVNASGVATLTTSTLPVGTDVISASYAGDNTYGSSTSNTVSETVSKNTGSNTLVTSNASPTFGQSVTLTDTLAAVNGITPTGTVTFYNGSTVIGSASLNSSGVATVSTSTLPIGSDTITASYGGDSSNNASTSNAVTETVAKGTISGSLSSNNANPTFGQSVTITDTLTSINGVIPTGTVTFYNGGTSIGTGTVNASGVATLTTSTLPVGSDAITATYGGDTTYNSTTTSGLTETVTKGSTTSTLASSNAAPSFGQSVTFTDKLTSINGVAPTGTVTFYNGSTSIGTGTLSNGVATLSTSALPVGSDSITAVYAGDTNYNTSTSGAVTETVSKATGTNTLTTSNANPTYGQSITLTDTLSLANGVAPTGTVTFYNGSTAIGTGSVNASGVATLATANLPVGTDSITATYGGDSNFNTTTSSPVTETVAKATAAGTLTSSNTSPSYGSSVTFTDTLAPVNGTTPTGTVTFYNGTTAIGTGTLSNGVATLTTGALPVGTDSITAVYNGDANYLTSTSNAVSESVSKNTGTGTLTTSNGSPSFGQSVTLTDTLSAVNGTVPTGSVTFYSGSTVLGTGTVSNTGVATLATSALPTGTDSVTAVYAGDPNYNTNTSNAVTENVAKASATNSLASSNTTPNYGQSVTFTATLSSVNSVFPTGTVTFYNGTTSLGSAPVNASGVATLTSSALPVGTDSVTASYGGDTNFAASTSAAVSETVGKAAGSGTLTTSNATPSYGQSVTLTDTLGSVNGLIPTGTVTFYSGTASLGTGTVSSTGVATLSTSALAVGTNSVTAVYGGNGTYSSNTSNAVAETVSKGAAVGTLTTSNASPTAGQSVTLTDTLPTVNGVVPTGTVTFYNGSTAIGTGTVSTAGIATLTTGSLPVGTDSITAVYGGDNVYASSTSNAVTETVTKNAGSSTLATSNASPSYGQSVTLTDTVPTANGVVPTGTVTFYNGTTAIGSSSLNGSGVATFATSTLPVGTDSITAVYAGDGSYASSTSNAVIETVSKNQGTGTLSTSNAAPTYGQSVTLTDTLPSVNGTVPTGSVTFYNGSTAIGTGTVNASGVATLSTSTLPVGTNSITATYGGDTNYASTTSNAVTETVAKNGAAGTLTSSNTTPSAGQSVTFTDTLPVVNGVAPTGTVTFYNGTTAIGTGTVNTSGVATLTTGLLPVGTDSITATYGGDTNYASTTSNAVTETVAKNGATGTLSSSNTAPTYGQSVTLTDTLAAVNGLTPTGSVTFYNGSSAIGTVSVNASGVATLSTSTLPVGTDKITAVYGGDSSFGTGTSNAVTETVAKSGAAGTLTTSNASPTYGQSITLTDTLPIVNGVAPTGTVTFYNGTTSLGTGTVDASGIATLSTGSLPVGTDSITAVYGGDSNYSTNTSNAITETVAKSGAAGTLTTSNASPSYGQSITLTDTLPTVNGVVPTGTVTFYNGTTVIGTGTVNGSGIATLSTGSLPVGTDSITAVYGGDSNYSTNTSNVVTENVGKSAATGALTTSNAAPTYGQSVTLTDTLPTVNGVAPTGTVTFYNGTTVLGTGTVNASGVATLATGSLPVGTDSITAVYGGDSNYSTSTAGPLTETVAKASGTNQLTTSDAAPNAGQAVTFTDALSTVSGVAPTGTVTFYNGTTALGTGMVNSSGIATLTTTSLPLGTDTITAVYAGDTNYASTTSNAVTETVTKNTGAGSLTTSNSAPSFGQSVTFTDTLPTSNGIVPTGTVTFYNGTTSLGTSPVNSSGVATLATSTLPVGTDSVTAVYSGDASYSQVTSNAVTETVSKNAGTGTLTSSNVAPNSGQSVTLTDTLSSVNGVVPTGTVTFYNGTTSLGTGTVNASGVATLATSALPVGTDMVTAVYGGDSNYASNTSNAVTETISKNTGAGNLVASSTTPALGQAVTLTDTLATVNGIVPTGTVVFYNGTTVVGTGTVNSSGIATLSTSTLPVGADSITAVYSGDGNYGSNTSNAVTVTVAKSTGAGTLTTSNASPSYGQSVTLTDTLPTVNGVVPTGTVTFYNGSTAIGTGTVNASGVATLTTGSLPVGSDSITAVYGGDSNYSTNTSNAVVETVGKTGAMGTLTASSTTPGAGQSITLTDTLPAVNGVVPTGTVTFYNGTTAIGTGTVNASGVATLTTGSLPVGSDSITAVYGGDSNYSNGSSNALTVTVGKGSGTGVLTTSNSAPTYGQSVTLSDTLTTTNGVVPTGTVTFYNGTTVVGTGTVNGSGIATLATSTLPVGADSITAAYAGDANYSAGTSNAVTVTVAKSTGAGTLTTSNASPNYGQSITLTDTLPTVNGVVPTGTVTFYNGSTAIGTGTVNASGVATLTTGSLPVGSDSITAVYGGDTNYSSNTSNAVVETIGKTSATGTLTASSTTPGAGQSITLTDTLPMVNGVVPTGTVTFYNGSTAIGTGIVNASGVATLTTGSLPVGSDSITAVYGGDFNYSNGSSNALTVTVGKNTGTGTLTTSNAAPNAGQSVTLTDTLSTSNGIVPTGTVTFYSGTTAIGTVTVDSKGVATFATSALPVGTDSVTAVYAGDTNYNTNTSNAVTETVAKNAGAGTLTASNASPKVGDSITLTDTLPVVNGVVPTGTVTFYNGTTAIGTGTVNTSGVATLTTGSLPVGSDSITAVYGGDTNYSTNTAGPLAIAVGKGTSTGTLTSSNATPNVGQSVTLTDTLTPVNGIMPTGTVTFYSGSTALGTGTVNSTGVATLATTTLPVGTDSVTAVYGGDSSYSSSTSNAVTETVAKGAGTGTLTASSTTPNFGDSITLTETLPTVNGIVPTGTVTFYNGTTAIGTGTLNASGVATLVTGALPVGSNSITAVYGGDGNYSGGTSNALVVTVGKNADTATLSTSNTATSYGQSVTFTATLSSVNGVYPTGAVTFMNGTDTLGTGTLNSTGVATLTTTSLPVGTDSVTASFPGDNNYSAATSKAVTVTVTKNAGTSTLATSNANPSAGQPVTFTDTLAITGNVIPTGTVTFYNGTTAIGTATVDSKGIATLTSGSLPTGVDTVTAVYAGDSTYGASTSNAVTETVAKNIQAGTLTASSSTPAAGQSVTLTVTQPTVNGVVPTGTVTFYNGTTVIGTGTLNANGVATLVTSSLPSGTDAISARYAGDDNYFPAATNTISVVVGKGTGTNVLTTSNASPSAGQQVTFTATLSTVNSVVPTGTVTFYNGTTVLGTGTVNSSGIATLTTNALPVGTDTVTANYGGDTNYTTSVSNAVTENVAKGNAGGTLTASTTTPTYGQSVVLTDTLPVSNGNVPTGTVTFYNGSTVIGTGTVNASGVATLTTASLPVGADSLTAVYGGDATYSSATSTALTVNVAKASTTSVLASSNASPNYGQTVTFTDTLSVVNGTAPTGTVTFYNNGTTVLGTGTVNSSGIATLSTSALPTGTDNVTAVYAGDGTYATSTSNAVKEVVTKATNSGTLTTSNAAPSFGQTVTFTDTLPIVNTVVPTGTVTFFSGTTELGTSTVNSSGIATLASTSLPVGTSSVTAVYSGDTNFSDATSNQVAETVSKSAGTGTLTTSNASPVAGQQVTFTDTLPIVNGIAPTGTVTFYNGTTAIGTGTINASGVATLTTGSLPVGAASITAVYAGDSNYSGNTSNAITMTVAKASGTGVLTSSNAMPAAGQSVTFTDTLPTSNGVAPTGTVTFYNGTTAIGTGTLNASGVATLSTSTLPVGTDTITAVYAGDSNYSTNTSNAVQEIVAKATGTGVLTSSNLKPTFGDSVTLTDTLPVLNGAAPTGTVTFYSGTTALGTGTVNSSGVASLSTKSLPIGIDTVTAVYAGDSNYSGNTSNAVTETVAKASTANVLTTSNGAPAAGQSVTLTDTLSAVNGVMPTGTVTFYNGTTTLGTGTVNGSGLATLSTGAFSIGSNNVTAVYSGDNAFASGTSNAVTEIVAKGNGMGVLTTSNATPAVGQSVTLTDKLPVTNGVVPTGTVTFYNGTVALGTGTVNASGVATLATTALPVGTDTVTAVFGGDSNYATGTSNTVTETVGKAAGTNVLASSNPTPNFGDAVLLTATLSKENGILPTGTVTFYSGTTTLGTGTVNASGVAMVSTTALPVGTDTVTAVYGGDSNYATSTSNAVTETVAKASSMGVLTTSNAAPALGQAVTLTDTLPVTTGAAPTGTVTFYSGTTVLGTGTVNASGVATLSTSSFPVGTSTVTAVYAGDSTHTGGTSNSVIEMVAQNAGNLVLTTSLTSAAAGQPVTLTATIPKVGSTSATGTVTFYSGTTAVGTGTLNASGVATLTTSSLPIGTDPIKAVYGGDASYQTSTSNIVSVVVTAPAPTVTLTSSPNPQVVGAPVVLTATLTGAAGQSFPGTVGFFNGTTLLGNADVSSAGVATLTVSTLQTGVQKISSVYTSTDKQTTVNSGTVSQSVIDFTIAAATPTLTVNGGSLAAFTLNLDPSTGITFGNDITLSVSGLPAGYTATFSPTKVTPGKGTAATQMSVQTIANPLTTTAQVDHNQHGTALASMALGLLLTPLLGIGRIRRRLPKVAVMIIAGLITFGLTAPVMGCGGGYFGSVPNTYTLTVTGTSGTLQHSTTVTLTVR